MAALAIPAAGDPALQGAWAVVTGGTRGIGLEVARGLVSRGIHVLIVGRDAGAGKAAVESLGRSAAGGAQARFEAGDLSRLGEVPALARRIAGIVPRLKYLIHNAAVVTPRRLVTPEGFETQFAVNHLAPYSLTRDLIPALLSAPEARIVVTASQVERGADLDLDDLMGSKGYEPFRAYGQSKLANVLFTYELAERLAGSSVTVNCLHPGVVRTALLDTLGAVQTANQPRESGGPEGCRRAAPEHRQRPAGRGAAPAGQGLGPRCSRGSRHDADRDARSRASWRFRALLFGLPGGHELAAEPRPRTEARPLGGQRAAARRLARLARSAEVDLVITTRWVACGLVRVGSRPGNHVSR